MIRALLFALALASSAHATPPTDAPPDAATIASYRAHLTAAEATLRLHEAPTARAMLDAAPAALRDWTWRWLDARADESAMTIDAHPGAVAFDVRRNRDGTRLVTAGRDGRARVWDGATGIEVVTIDAGADGLFAAAFTADGTRVITGGSRAARLWDAATGAAIATVWTSEQTVSCVDASPAGDLLAASSYRWTDLEARELDGLVRLVDATTLEPVRTLHGGRKPISMIRFSPDGRRLAASCWDGFVHVWEVDRVEPVLALSMEHPALYSAVDSVAWSPDGSRLAAGAKNGWVRVFDAADGAVRHTFSGHDGHLGGVAFTSDGRAVISGGQDGTLRRWDLAGDAAPRVRLGHTGAVHGVTATPDGTAWSVADDGTLRAWRLDPAPAMTHEDAYTVSLAADGRRLATSSYHGAVRLWDLERAILDREIAVPGPSSEDAGADASVNVVALAPDGARLAVGTNAGAAFLLDADGAAAPIDLGRHASRASGVVWSGDGALVVVGHGDDTVRAFDAATGSLRWITRRPADDAPANGLGGLDVSADGAHVAAPWGRAAVILAAADGAIDTVLDAGTARVRCVRFAPDGRSVLAGAADGTVLCWDAASGAERWRDRAAGDGPVRIALAPDGTRVASAGERVVLRDVATGAVVLAWRPHATGIYDLAFTPDGRRLVTLGHDDRIIVHDAGIDGAAHP